MSGTIIPLWSGVSATSALAHFDKAAMELLRQGRAETLSLARLDAILAELRARRTELAAVIADLQERPLSGYDQIDAVNTALSSEASKGLTQIDLLIEHVRICAAGVDRPRSES